LAYIVASRSNFQLRILEQNENDTELVFEMIGVDVSLANALRRIMIAEVPTLAIEHVYMWNNSSIIHDEGDWRFDILSCLFLFGNFE
jgi:DNA-directed RNA polymerase I and III subunit RPAC1